MEEYVKARMAKGDLTPVLYCGGFMPEAPEPMDMDVDEAESSGEEEASDDESDDGHQ